MVKEKLKILMILSNLFMVDPRVLFKGLVIKEEQP